MKTKELIDLLKKEDPTGEAHIRVAGGVIQWVERKPGYYDGPYEYFEDGKMVFSDEGVKIDLHLQDLEGFMWEDDSSVDDLIFRYSNSRKKDIEYIKSQAKKYKDESEECNRQLYNDMVVAVLNKIKKYHQIFQSKDEPIGRYNVMFWDGIKIDNDGQRRNQLMQGECAVVLKSGFFEPKDSVWKDFIEWKLTL